MKITDVKTVLLTGPCTDDPYLSKRRKRRSAAFVEIHTDTECVGLGETYAGYFCPEVVPEIVDFFKPIVLGRDVSDIDQIWADMYRCGNFWCRVGLGTVVLSGIEAALWDLKAKTAGVPVFELLGQCKHDRLLAYASGGPSNYPKQELADKIDFYLSLGFTAFKLGAGSFSEEQGKYVPTSPQEAADFEADKMAFVRQHVGPDVTVMMDGHMGNSSHTWDLATAQAVLQALEPFDLFFFEEPLHYTDPWGYAELCKTTNTPVAGGECLTAAYEWQVFAERDAFDIAQPDASFVGGLIEFIKVADMLERRGRRIATHAWGAAGSLMQNIHCAFVCGNTAVLEIPPAFGPLHGEILLPGTFQMKDGMVLPPENPGLGILLTESIKNKYPFVPGSGEFNSVPGKILQA